MSATQAQDENGVANRSAESSNAFAVRAKNVKTGEYKVLRTFFDFRHTAAEDYARELRRKHKDLPLKFEVASGFYKCWSCGDHSTDERFLTRSGEGNRVCRRCFHAPEIPRDVWTGERIDEGTRTKRAEGDSR